LFLKIVRQLVDAPQILIYVVQIGSTVVIQIHGTLMSRGKDVTEEQALSLIGYLSKMILRWAAMFKCGEGYEYIS